METYILDDDLHLLCIRATSFPEGVLAAHQQLHGKFPEMGDRRYFGISRPENGVIVYKAAAEALHPGEAEKLSCETFTLPKGEYISERIDNFMSDIPRIRKTFEHLLSDPRIDPNGCCVEMYLGLHDLRCMVRIDSTYKQTESI